MRHGRVHAQDAGRGDQDVEPAPTLEQGRAQPVQAVAVGDVEGDKRGALAGQGQDLVIEFFERALGAADRDHMRAGAGKAQGDGAADAARGAGHQGDTAGKGEGGGCI